MSQTDDSAVVGSQAEVRVGFGSRFAAYLIDFILVAGLAVALRGVAASLFPATAAALIAKGMADPRAAAVQGVVRWSAEWGLALAVIAPLYTLIEGLVGWSPGKLLLGLRVAAAAGTPAPHDRLLVRYLAKNASGLIGAVATFTLSHPLELVSRVMAVVIIIGCFLVLRRDHLALHDKIAGTAVLRKADLALATPSTASATP